MSAPEVPADVKARADAIEASGGEPRYYMRMGKIAVMNVSKARRRSPNRFQTLDAVVKMVEAEMPHWHWRVGQCRRSAHASVAYDCKLSPEAYAFDNRFDSGFDVDLHHIERRRCTPAEALLQAFEVAKGARDQFRRETGRVSEL